MTDRVSAEGLQDLVDDLLACPEDELAGTAYDIAEGLREALRDLLHYESVHPLTGGNKTRLEAVRAALRDTGPRPDSGIDPRVVEAFDVLGAMWSWSEDNGYFATGSGAVLAAGRLLKEVVGRPAQPLSTPRTETSE